MGCQDHVVGDHGGITNPRSTKYTLIPYEGHGEQTERQEGWSMGVVVLVCEERINESRSKIEL